MLKTEELESVQGLAGSQLTFMLATTRRIYAPTGCKVNCQGNVTVVIHIPNAGNATGTRGIGGEKSLDSTDRESQNELKEIVYLRKNVFVNFDITVFYCVIKNKHLP